MNSIHQYPLSELARHIGGELVGDPDIQISGIGTLADAKAGEISFLSNKLYKKALPQTQASAVILSSRDVEQCPTHAILVEDPYLGYAKIATLLFADKEGRRSGIAASATVDSDAFIHESACISHHCVVEAGAVVGEGVYLGAGVFIGEGVTIGSGSAIYANASIYAGTFIGKKVIVHSGAVLGADGFGIVHDSDKGQWLKVPQLGRVLIGSDVEIGANTTIDRGAIGDTVIEDNVKLDNLIQVAHNVHIGSGTAVAGCVGISGSTHIGKNCLIGGGAGLAGHLEIVDNVIITGMGMVTKSIKKPGVYSSGIPVKENAVWRRMVARVSHLDKTLNKLIKTGD